MGKVIVFCCDAAYYGLNMVSKLIELPEEVEVVRVPCLGRVEFEAVVRALLDSANVVLAGCHQNNCKNIDGSRLAKMRVELLRRMLEFIGMNADRVKHLEISTYEGLKLVEFLNEFATR